MKNKKRISSLFITIVLTIIACSVQAHHVLGRPSYSLGSDSNTPPSLQVETQMGEFYVTYMAFPAFPVPNQRGRVNLYASRIDNGKPSNGEVTFKVIDSSWFSDKQEVLGVQLMDDNVYRQGFEFSEEGDYIIRAEFESKGIPYQLDFPLQIGNPGSFGPLGIAITFILTVLIAVNLLQRKNLTRAKIKSTRVIKTNNGGTQDPKA